MYTGMYCAVNLQFCTASRLKPPPWRDVACRCRAGPRYCQKGKDRVCRQIAQPSPKSGDRYRGRPSPLHLYCHPCGVLYSITPSTLSHLVYYHTYLTVSYSPYCSIILTLQYHTCTIITGCTQCSIVLQYSANCHLTVPADLY